MASIASTRPSAIVCSCARGASTASVSLMKRALSSYMIIATRRPLSWPIMRSASKLPRWAPKASTPRPALNGAMIVSTPLASKANSSKRSCNR